MLLDKSELATNLIKEHGKSYTISKNQIRLIATGKKSHNKQNQSLRHACEVDSIYKTRKTKFNRISFKRELQYTSDLLFFGIYVSLHTWDQSENRNRDHKLVKERYWKEQLANNNIAWSDVLYLKELMRNPRSVALSPFWERRWKKERRAWAKRRERRGARSRERGSYWERKEFAEVLKWEIEAIGRNGDGRRRNKDNICIV